MLVEQAAQNLKTALGPEPEAATEPLTPASDSQTGGQNDAAQINILQEDQPGVAPALSLNDVAAMLAAIEPGDHAELAAVRDALRDLVVGSAGCTPAFVNFIAEAAGTVEGIVQATAVDPDGAYAYAGQLI